MKVWIDERDTADNALDLYHPASRVGRVVKALAVCSPRVFFPLICRGEPDVATRTRLEFIAAAIGERLGGDVEAVSVSPGTAGNHQKMTAQVSGRTGVIAYVKAADTPAVVHLLDNEAAMLSWLADKELGPTVVPKVIGLDRAKGLTLLLQGPPPAPAQPRGLAPDNRDAAFLSALMATGRNNVFLGQILENWRATGRADRRNSADKALDALHNDVETALASVLPSQKVAISASHGDYAPWNCLNLSDGRLFVFDWEYGSREAPILGDLFHRVLMPAQLLRRTPPARLVRRLLLLEADPVFGAVVTDSGITRAELPGYLLLYLLQMAYRSREQQGAVSPYIEGCLLTCLDAVNGVKRPRNAPIAACV